MNFAEMWQEARAIIAQLAQCEVDEEHYWHPIDVPDDVDQWQLIERAKKLTEAAAQGESEARGDE